LPEHEAQTLRENKSSAVGLTTYYYTQHAWLSNPKTINIYFICF